MQIISYQQPKAARLYAHAYSQTPVSRTPAPQTRRAPAAARPAEPEGLSQAELRRIVIDMIG